MQIPKRDEDWASLLALVLKATAVADSDFAE